MSDLNSQIKIHMIESIKDQSIGTKTSLEKLNNNLNNILQELHKNAMKESNSNMLIKSSNKEEENNNNENSDFIGVVKKNEEEINEQDKEKTTGDNVGDNNIDKISNKNLIKIKISGEYKSSSDINLINKRSSDFNLIINNSPSQKNEIIEDNDNKKENNEIKEEKNIKIEENEKKEENDKETNEDNNNNEEKEKQKENEQNLSSKKNIEITNDNINNNKNDIEKYSYRPMSDVTMSSIGQNHINSFNMTQGSELYLNEIIDKLVEKDSEKESDGLTDSVKIDPNEVIHLGLTNFQLPKDEGTHSVITNELDKACIKTNDFTKSKDIISNIDSSGLQREGEKPTNVKTELNQEKNNSSFNASTNINNINEKKSGIDILFGKEIKKDQSELIKENRKEIERGINKMYEKELSLVKINNKEKFSYITKYNDPDKDKLGYEPDYFFCNKNSINFLNRRNNFLSHKYFSYILSKKEKINNNNIKEKDKKKKPKEKTKEDLDINDNFEYNEEEVLKYKKKYDEKIEPLTISINYINANTNNLNYKKHRIYDVEDMSSFFYYFNLYSPEDKFKNNLERESENEILKSFISYRKVLNDGNSFIRAFIYSLLENYLIKIQNKKLDYIIYDINNLMKKKNDIKQICNLLIDIKENSSIDYLMQSFNNPTINFDEILINYIELNIRKVLGIENNKKKYIEIDYNIMKILVNIFEINLEIYYIEEEQAKLKMNKIAVYNNTYLLSLKNTNLKTSNNSDNDCSITFRFLYFLNSYYIIYTDKSDIDSSFSIINNEKQYYYIDNLPSYKCPNCKKNTGLDIIPTSEAIFCHICLNKYLKEILEKRVVLFIKSNFSCIEYYTRPIKISSDIIINFSLYKYITKNYIINDFEKILEKSCFKCYKILNEKDKIKIKKLKCQCQLCETCLEKTLKDNLKDKNYLNKYEMHNLPKIKCLCGNDMDFPNLLKLSKNKPNEKDKKLAEDRLLNLMKKKCCLCHESNEQKLFDFKIMQGPPHLMCLNCYEKEQKKESNIKEENDKDSNDNIISSKNSIIKRKLFCKICYEEHIWIDDSDITDKKNNLPKLKCCKDNCFII